MKSLLNIFIFTICSFTFAQQIEFGAYFGYGYNNIVDARIKEGRAVIGDALWDLSKGGIITYYFKTPDQNHLRGRLSVLYKNEDKGSRSETFKEAKYQFNSNMFGLLFGAGREIGNGFLLYTDVGLGYTMFDTENIYKGNVHELDAFLLMDDYFEIKDHEINFLFDLGLEKIVLKDRLKLFFEMNTNPAIARFNKSEGKYRNQGIGFSLGAKYVINFKKDDTFE